MSSLRQIPEQVVSCPRRFVDVICGTGKGSSESQTAEELEALEKLSSLTETKFEVIVLNTMAVFMFSCSLVLWIVFA